MSASVRRSRTSRIGPGSAARSPSIMAGCGCTKTPSSGRGLVRVDIPCRPHARGGPMVRGVRTEGPAARSSAGLGGAGDTVAAARPARRSSPGARRTCRSGGRSRGGGSPRRASSSVAGSRWARTSGPRKIVILLGTGDAVGAERRARHALVEPVQAGARRRSPAGPAVGSSSTTMATEPRRSANGRGDGRWPARWRRRRRRRSRRRRGPRPTGRSPHAAANATVDEDRHELGRVELGRELDVPLEARVDELSSRGGLAAGCRVSVSGRRGTRRRPPAPLATGRSGRRPRGSRRPR